MTSLERLDTNCTNANRAIRNPPVVRIQFSVTTVTALLLVPVIFWYALETTGFRKRVAVCLSSDESQS